ncbi:bifunctional adenosylcobinamide kinase/adenosylcobinamide-phosphate guanylyltransferase [Bradyrhizobium hipponense]|uniref:Bifunctional adenosylcobalamin biosynthesis protein n=2 Tax=Bradyrhizobium hipponense TaxID=2605638 RepID=A0A5S4YTG6_9BRAD|nr:bifunctional adenosylcobinamide kinase/adenosylcobinamide-phosphate guanylyltransferase [Bradyrhizobium hipponense]
MISAGRQETFMAVILITGGARSGKSKRAEARARAFPGRPVYVATAEALDAEMEERIATHRARRGTDWIEREVPLDLAQALVATDGGGARLVDCLTLWLSNLLHAEREWEREVTELAGALPRFKSPVLLVTNEVGLGIVPDNALARSFRDAAGIMNQIIADVADEVEFVVAGLPMKLK